jgi:hypothetical protein
MLEREWLGPLLFSPTDVKLSEMECGHSHSQGSISYKRYRVFLGPFNDAASFVAVKRMRPVSVSPF